MSLLPFYLVTPERVVYQGQVDGVSLPTVDGEITVLPHHIPLVTALTHGVIRLHEGKSQKFLSVSEGVAKIDSMGVTVLTTTAEHAEELVIEQVEKALADAKKLAHEKRGSDEEFAQAMAMIARESARLRAVHRARGRGRAFGGDSSFGDTSDTSGTSSSSV